MGFRMEILFELGCMVILRIPYFLGGNNVYQALYRKWRPRTFDEISGQQHITKILRLQCLENRVSHAYLFCGTRGTGKTSTAKILAKAINCENPSNGNPCNCCYACTSIDSGNATDVLEIDAASNNGVDDIRDLRDEVVYPPSMLKKRVYIIDEVHMLSTGAFNALLKTLEEPPEYIAFILATTELSKLPATIISRCIRFDFSRLSEDIIADRIRYVAEQEHISLGEGAAELLARLADGALRDGLSILEACTSGVGEGNEITAEAIRERLGIADADQLLAYYRGICSKDTPAALTILNEVHSSSKDITIFVEDVSALARDLLVLRQMKTVPQRGGLFRFQKEAEQLLREYPDVLTTEALFHICAVLEETLGHIGKYATNKKMLLEFATIKLCDFSLSDSTKALLARISRLEKLLANGVVSPVDTVPATPEIQPKAESKAEVVSQPKSNGKAFTKYAELAEEMMGHPDLLPYIQKIKASIEDGKFVITADAFTNQMLQLGSNPQALNEAVRMVTGQAYEILFRDRTNAQEEDPLNEL